MTPHHASANLSNPGSRPEPTNIQRRIFIGGGLATLVAACSSPTEQSARRFSSSDAVMDERRDGEEDVPNDPFIVLLKGLYQPVPKRSGQHNFGLTTVDLGDGSYSKTRIYPIFGIRGSRHQDKPIGTFYVQFTGNLCAYDLPGGAIAMKFNDPPAGVPPELGFNNFSSLSFPDGQGGNYLEGTFEVVVLEATGVYRAFTGGHNHMVDRLHQLADGSFDEFCFCNISQYQFP